MIRSLRMALFALCLASSALAAPLPYDETADAEAAVKQALATAQRSRRPVLLILGANWCEDCRALDRSLSTGENAKLMAQAFNVVKVDVGQFDRNLAISERYGNPVKKGIPAAVLLSPANEVLYVTKAGELADARHMSDTGVYDFFRRIAAGAGSAR